ncbi:MAG TPA: gluconokinase [Blastocatellia bacterium]|nr:gluconokinase [Blastocatellia bacterium]
MPDISLEECAPPLVIAIDLGTSSARAILFDGAGRQVEGLASRVPYRMTVTQDGGAEISADRLVDILAACLDDLVARIVASTASGAAPRPNISAVAMCTFWHALMGVDSEGRAVTPLYSWNDTRAASAARALRERLDERAIHSRTGCRLHASYWPAKLAWLREADPDAFARTSRWISIGEYFHLRLFGEASMSISMASATGLLDQSDCAWDEELLSHLDISSERLPPLIDSAASGAGLGDEFAARWPLLAGAEWFPALGDGACGNIGSGCVTRDRAALMIGTSGALRVLWKAEKVSIPAGLFCYRADRLRFVMGGALSNGGDLFEWMHKTFNLGEAGEAEGRASAMEPDSHGLTVLPFLSGERSTGWADDARAAITGLRLDTTPDEILRAGLESVAYRFAAIYDQMVEEAGEPREIVGSGAGLLRSPVWAQIIADVTGKRIVASDEAESSSRGAALKALEALGAIGDLERAEASFARAYAPDFERHRLYKRARARQNRLYDAVIGEKTNL